MNGMRKIPYTVWIVLVVLLASNVAFIVTFGSRAESQSNSKIFYRSS